MAEFVFCFFFLLFQSGEPRGGYMHTNISVFIVLNKCKFCVVNYSSNIRGYFVDIKNEKWGGRLDMHGAVFNKYLHGETDKGCVRGKWVPGKSLERAHLWKTDHSCEKKYLTQCQELLCKCIDVAQK